VPSAFSVSRPYALGDERVALAARDHSPHELRRLRRDREAEFCEACGEARYAQDADGVLDEGVRDVAQKTRLEVVAAAEGIDDVVARVARDGVDREVAPAEILLERDVRRGVDGEPAVAGRGLALGARQRVLLARARMEEDGEVAADGTETQRRQLVRRRADDDPVALADGQTEQFVAERAADLKYLHDGADSSSARSRARRPHVGAA
jgi:hypothetical protein